MSSRAWSTWRAVNAARQWQGIGSRRTLAQQPDPYLRAQLIADLMARPQRWHLAAPAWHSPVILPLPIPNGVPNNVDTRLMLNRCQRSSGYRSERCSVTLGRMTDDEHIREIRKARQTLNRALEATAKAERALATEIRAAYKDGLKTGPISHAAEWSDTYVRSIREGKVLQ